MSTSYIESIERFTDKVDTAAVDNIVKYLGIALQSSDGSTVAASDAKELATIENGVCAKKLGMDASQAKAAIEEVCEIMKHDSAKCRVTFYYLLADKANKLDAFGG
jgi:hypothetical protein